MPARPKSREVQVMTSHALHTRRLTVLRADALFDGVSSTLMAEPSVVITDGAITAVHGPDEPSPAGASIIDLPGLTLMPGLVDTHLHLCFDATGDPVGHLAETRDDLLREQMAEAARRAPPAGAATVPGPAARRHPALGLPDRGPAGRAQPPPPRPSRRPPHPTPRG